MKILVLNCGSSSVKTQLIETGPDLMAAGLEKQLGKVSVEKVGSNEAIIHAEIPGSAAVAVTRPIPTHREAVETAVHTLMERLAGVIRNLEEIEGVGHRIVHGGERFTVSAPMTGDVVREIENTSSLAPLHNPENLKGYYAAREVLPQARHVAVFDTAFHQTLPPRAYMYGLPYAAYSHYRIRRYGFHGTSHRYVTGRYAELHGATPASYRLITCHLGNGCSISAVDRGRSVDTSMGFTPLEGLLMGTRSGDVDPAAVLYLMERETLSPEDAARLLNQESGLLGLSGVASDMRTIVDEARKGHERAQLALEVFCYRVRKYIGAYLAVLGGCDALIFTGGIGENRSEVRARICESLGALGIRIDPARNEAAGGIEMKISPEGAGAEVWVIPTNEELLIARDTVRCIVEAGGR